MRSYHHFLSDEYDQVPKRHIVWQSQYMYIKQLPKVDGFEGIGVTVNGNAYKAVLLMLWHASD